MHLWPYPFIDYELVAVNRQCRGASVQHEANGNNMLDTAGKCASECAGVAHMFGWKGSETDWANPKCLCFTATTNLDSPGRCEEGEESTDQVHLYRFVEGM